MIQFLSILWAGIVLQTTSTEFLPTTLILDRNAPITTLELTNNSSSNTSYELTGYRWSQVNGEDIYEPDSALIVIPPILTLGPAQNATIRVGLTPEMINEGEQAFRLLIRDISPTPPTQRGLNLRLNVLLPVFVKATEALTNIELRQTEIVAEQFCLTGRNAGNHYIKITGIHPAGTQDNITPLQHYLLPGTTSTVCTQRNLVEAEAYHAIVGSAYHDQPRSHLIDPISDVRVHED